MLLSDPALGCRSGLHAMIARGLFGGKAAQAPHAAHDVAGMGVVLAPFARVHVCVLIFIHLQNKNLFPTGLNCDSDEDQALRVMSGEQQQL